VIILRVFVTPRTKPSTIAFACTRLTALHDDGRPRPSSYSGRWITDFEPEKHKSSKECPSSKTRLAHSRQLPHTRDRFELSASDSQAPRKQVQQHWTKSGVTLRAQNYQIAQRGLISVSEGEAGEAKDKKVTYPGDDQSALSRARK
jgi:hypothetical protein